MSIVYGLDFDQSAFALLVFQDGALKGLSDGADGAGVHKNGADKCMCLFFAQRLGQRVTLPVDPYVMRISGAD